MVVLFTSWRKISLRLVSWNSQLSRRSSNFESFSISLKMALTCSNSVLKETVWAWTETVCKSFLEIIPLPFSNYITVSYVPFSVFRVSATVYLESNLFLSFMLSPMVTIFPLLRIIILSAKVSASSIRWVVRIITLFFLIF